MPKLKQEIDKLTRDDVIVFRDNLVRYLYSINTDDPHKIIGEVYRLLTDLSDKMK